MSLVIFLCLSTLCVGLATARIRRISSVAMRGRRKVTMVTASAIHRPTLT